MVPLFTAHEQSSVLLAVVLWLGVSLQCSEAPHTLHEVTQNDDGGGKHEET